METIQSGVTEVFVQESADLLNSIEQCLVALEQKRDESVIHELFRCFHTLKGSAGMAGFEMVSSLTHRAENRLDTIRNGQAEFSAQDVDLFLRIVDWVRDAVQGVADKELHVQLGEELGMVYSGPDSAPGLHGPLACRVYRVRIRFRPDIFNFGLDPLIVIQDIDDCGTILQLSSGKADVPALAELDPEQCYLNCRSLLKHEKPR
jgi:two-component system chemotaxis sensor kinase CheA